MLSIFLQHHISKASILFLSDFFKVHPSTPYWNTAHTIDFITFWLKSSASKTINVRPTIRQPSFHLRRQQWSLLNRFRTEQGHCGACRRKWRLTDTDPYPCGKTQTMSHTVESCPLTKLNGGLSRLHSADEDAVSWLTNYGSWHAYEKKRRCKLAQVVPEARASNDQLRDQEAEVRFGVLAEASLHHCHYRPPWAE